MENDVVGQLWLPLFYVKIMLASRGEEPRKVSRGVARCDAVKDAACGR